MKTVFFILKQKKRAKSAIFFALLLTPPLAYAIWVFTSFLLDSLQGDGLMEYLYVFESRRQLAFQMLSDGRQALPVFYVTGLLLWLEIHLLARFSEWSGILPALLAGALTGLIVSAVFVEMNPVVIAPSVASAIFMSLVVSWAVRPSRVQG